MTLAQGLGRFVADLDLVQVPPPVVEKARTCLLNGYGIALGGHATPFAPVARRAALAEEGAIGSEAIEGHTLEAGDHIRVDYLVGVVVKVTRLPSP